MGKYEILYIVHPDLEASIDKITDRVRSLIETKKGKIYYEENWGKRKLAYEIRKTDVGIYLLWYFEVAKDAISKIERDLRLTEEIMRYMITAQEEKIKPQKEEKLAKKEEKPEKEEVKKTESRKSPAKTKKSVAEKSESEEERMKKLDEKLGAILADEGDNSKKVAKPKKETK